MKRNIYILSLASLIFTASCKEDARIDLVDDNKPAPIALTEVTIKSILGGAVLKYQLPKDENLLCIKAVYEIRPGKTYEAKGSVYVDSLVLRGFGSSNTTQVKIYSVGKNGKESQPLLVDVTPDKPVVEDVAESINFRRAVGGIKFSYNNKSKENLTYELVKEIPELKRWESIRKFYSGLVKGDQTQRGLEAVETNFGLIISDRWGNVSDTIKSVMTPVFEEEIPKPWAHKQLKGDSWAAGRPDLTIDKLWDGRWDVWDNHLWASSGSTVFPQSFTIDLGHLIEVTRVVEHQRLVETYKGTSVKRFDLFGTAKDSPNPDINSEDWIPLGTFDSYQPSGQTGAPTQEDIQYGSVEGENFEFVDEHGDPKPTPAIRYLRWRTWETWNGQTEMGEVIIAELEVFGKILDKK